MNATAGALHAMDYRCPRHGVEAGEPCPGLPSGRCNARIQIGWAHKALDAVVAAIVSREQAEAAAPSTVRSAR